MKLQALFVVAARATVRDNDHNYTFDYTCKNPINNYAACLTASLAKYPECKGNQGDENMPADPYKQVQGNSSSDKLFTGCSVMLRNTSNTCNFYFNTNTEENSVSSYYKRVCDNTVVAGAHDDPHITNVHGNHFNLHKSGRYNMLSLMASGFKSSVIASVENLNSGKCSPSYIRIVDVSISHGDTSRRIRLQRGSSNEFRSVVHEEFLACVDALDNCIDVRHFPGLFGEGLNAHAEQDIVYVDNGPVKMHVWAASNPKADRHYLNLRFSKINVTHDMEVSGLMWEDHVSSDEC